MGLLNNILGTIQTTFSIGKGTDEVGIRTNNGTLQGRNNGGSWENILRTSSVFVRNTSTQSISSGVLTKVTFPIEIIDNESEFSNSTYTANKTKTVIVSSSIILSQIRNGGRLELHIYKNGSSLVNVNNFFNTTSVFLVSEPNSDICSSICFPVDLNQGDTIEIYCFHNHGSPRNLSGNQFLAIRHI